MYTIHKYQLPIGQREFTLNISEDSMFLDVQKQNGNWVLWVAEWLEFPKKDKELIFIMTGEKFPDRGFNHLKTIQIDGIVLHLFEIT